jgi:hypothetical protein
VASRKPFSRRRRGGADGGPRQHDPWDLVRAFEYAARTWGWSAPYARQHETKERLLAYLDAAEERQERDFRESVEAVRLGTIFAHDGRAYGRWNQRRRSSGSAPSGGGGLTGMALERAIFGLAARNPEYVVRG